jgi:hypothetical protein
MTSWTCSSRPTGPSYSCVGTEADGVLGGMAAPPNDAQRANSARELVNDATSVRQKAALFTDGTSDSSPISLCLEQEAQVPSA